MAQSRDTAKSLIKTSVHGRRLGIDKDECLTGPKAFRHQVTNATSDTTGTTLAPFGLHTVLTTTNDSWQLQAPIPGVQVTIASGTTGTATSTGIHTILPVSGTFQSCESSTGGSIVITGVGAGVTLMGASTGLYHVVGSFGTTARVDVTT